MNSLAMCTSIIHRKKGTFGIGFNRDETIKRKKALEPQIYSGVNGTYLCPVDGDYGGTWIGVNSKGKLFAILNFYEATLKLIRNANSRGIIMKDLLSEKISELDLINLDLSLYYPFRILSIDDSKTILYIWNGIQIETEVREAEWEVIASSFMHGAQGEVFRKQVFFDKFYPVITEKSFFELAKDFLTSHEPEEGSKSPCMHRRDAHTQSQTIIQIENNKVLMSYKEGQPCKSNQFNQYELILDKE
jgi:Transport and Golgi organisation 2